MIYKLTEVKQIYDGKSVLSINDMQISEGEVLAIVGPSGAGKSTLLRLLAMIESSAQGHVVLSLNGHHFTYPTLPLEISRQVVMVFQRPILLSRSVRANIEYGLKVRGLHDQGKRVDTILDQFGIGHLGNAKTFTLSGGEAQRVAVARAFILQPEVLILDEPTTNLDPHNISVIETAILEQQRRSQITTIIVTHNIFQAKRLANRIAFIYDGQLVEVADVKTFFENPRDKRTAEFTSGQLIY